MTEPPAAAAAPFREQFAAGLRGRRSINLFAPDVPPRDVVLAAIEVARWAPNHRLTEPWRFYLLGPKARAAATELAVEIDTAVRGSRAGQARAERMRAIPGWLVLTSRESDDPLIARENYAACCCAAQNFMLYLWQLGIGVKWTTGNVTRDPRFYTRLEIDASAESVVGFFWYGYPKTVPEQRRRPVAEIATELA